VLAALVVVLAPAACGRTNLDKLIDVSGAGGRAGTTGGGPGVAGQGFAGQGLAGQGFAGQGFAGQGLAGQGFAGQGFAGQGFAGSVGPDLAGQGGGAGVGGFGGFAGFAGFATAGSGGTVATCVEGTDTCADDVTGEICVGGAWQTFTCAFGCFDGICAECSPLSATCVSDTQLELCNASGIRQAPTTCPGGCQDGACTSPASCVDDDTRCESPATQQTCKGGAWTVESDCEFVCVDKACTKDPRHVFVTSQAFVAGNLGGLTGADDACRQLAVAAGLSSSYAAWLSDSTGSPVSRFAQDVGPYLLVNGTIVANNWNDLTSGTLRHAIDLSESGGPGAPSPDSITSAAVWTDTTASGTRSTALFGVGGSCNDWSDPMRTSVVFGSTEFMDTGWTELGGESSDVGMVPAICATAAALYCFEQ
jgi:hypothetical protein